MDGVKFFVTIQKSLHAFFYRKSLRFRDVIQNSTLISSLDLQVKGVNSDLFNISLYVYNPSNEYFILVNFNDYPHFAGGYNVYNFKQAQALLPFLKNENSFYPRWSYLDYTSNPYRYRFKFSNFNDKKLHKFAERKFSVFIYKFKDNAGNYLDFTDDEGVKLYQIGEKSLMPFIAFLENSCSIIQQAKA